MNDVGYPVCNCDHDPFGLLLGIGVARILSAGALVCAYDLPYWCHSER